MAAQGRRVWVGANWKSNGSAKLVEELKATYQDVNKGGKEMDVVAFPPLPFVEGVRAYGNPNLQLGAQNVSHKPAGAFTGEVTAAMLAEAGLRWALVGHSERRQFYAETDEVVAAKVAAAGGVSLAVCVGESAAEHEAGQTRAVLKRQVEAFASAVTDWSRVVVAYEPIWAIGTGKAATPADVQETHAYVRSLLGANGPTTRIVYGGSVNLANCASYMSCPDVDGLLIGGASIKPDFNQLVNGIQI